jgi:hypothetical protein
MSWYTRFVDDDGRLWCLVQVGPCCFCTRTGAHRHLLDPVTGEDSREVEMT